MRKLLSTTAVAVSLILLGTVSATKEEAFFLNNGDAFVEPNALPEITYLDLDIKK